MVSEDMDRPHQLKPVDPIDVTLLKQRQRFLSFLEGRVESRAAAEEILQDAFARTVEKSHQLRDEENAVAWFYRLLRNAVIDHYRRRAAEARALESEARSAEDAADQALEPEATHVICACLHDVLPLLKEDQRAMLQAVDLDGVPVGEMATSLGLEAGTARVRLHRARQALKKELERVCTVCATHGCLDCTCGPSKG